MHSQKLMTSTPERSDYSAFFTEQFASIALVAGTTCGDRSQGEDIAQEAFARAHNAWETVSAMDKPGAWVRRVAINLAIGRRRRRLRESHALRRLGRPASTTEDRHGDPMIWAAIDELTPHQRAAIAMHYFEGCSTAEIGHALDCTQSTATSHLHNARTRLAQLLGAHR